MESAGSATRIGLNYDELRYEAWIDHQLAGLLYYSDLGPVRTLLHTEVLHGHEGKGVGGALVRHVLDELRSADGKVRLECPFADRWVDQHPDYADLVADGHP